MCYRYYADCMNFSQMAIENTKKYSKNIKKVKNIVKKNVIGRRGILVSSYMVQECKKISKIYIAKTWHNYSKTHKKISSNLSL